MDEFNLLVGGYAPYREDAHVHALTLPSGINPRGGEVQGKLPPPPPPPPQTDQRPQQDFIKAINDMIID
jgi:hypothetical protein